MDNARRKLYRGDCLNVLQDLCEIGNVCDIEFQREVVHNLFHHPIFLNFPINPLVVRKFLKLFLLKHELSAPPGEQLPLDDELVEIYSAVLSCAKQPQEESSWQAMGSCSLVGDISSRFSSCETPRDSAFSSSSDCHDGSPELSDLSSNLTDMINTVSVSPFKRASGPRKHVGSCCRKERIDWMKWWTQASQRLYYYASYEMRILNGSSLEKYLLKSILCQRCLSCDQRDGCSGCMSRLSHEEKFPFCDKCAHRPCRTQSVPPPTICSTLSGHIPQFIKCLYQQRFEFRKREGASNLSQCIEQGNWVSACSLETLCPNSPIPILYDPSEMESANPHDEFPACGTPSVDAGSVGSVHSLLPVVFKQNTAANGLGLRFWTASLILSNIVVSYPSYFVGKYIIELGCGVGMASVVISRVVQSYGKATDSLCPYHSHDEFKGDQNVASSEYPSLSKNQTSLGTQTVFVTTDHDPQVLINCKENLAANGITVGQKLGNRYVGVAHLDWFDMNSSSVKNVFTMADPWGDENSNSDEYLRPPLLVVAADSIYDLGLNVHFVDAISNLFEFDGRDNARAVVCSVERDVETFTHFLSQLSATGLNHKVVKYKSIPPESKGLAEEETRVCFDDLDSSWLTVADHFETSKMTKQGSPGRAEDGTDKGENDELLIDSTSRELSATKIVIIYPKSR